MKRDGKQAAILLVRPGRQQIMQQVCLLFGDRAVPEYALFFA